MCHCCVPKLLHCVQYIEYGQQSRDPPVKMQGSITTPGSLALAHVQAQSQQPGGPKAPQPGQPSTLVTTTTTTTTTAKTTTITRPTPSSFKKDVPVSSVFHLIRAELRSRQACAGYVVGASIFIRADRTTCAGMHIFFYFICIPAVSFFLSFF